MHRIEILMALSLAGWLSVACAAEFSGVRALADTRQVTAIGPRPPGSPELAKTRAYILAQLRPTGAQAPAVAKLDAERGELLFQLRLWPCPSRLPSPLASLWRSS